MTKVLPLLLAPVALALAVQARSSPPATDAPLSAVALGSSPCVARSFSGWLVNVCRSTRARIAGMVYSPARSGVTTKL